MPLNCPCCNEIHNEIQFPCGFGSGENTNSLKWTADIHSFQVHTCKQESRRAKETERQGAAVDLLFPLEGAVSERSHVEQHSSPLGSHSCRYLCSFSLSHALFLSLLISPPSILASLFFCCPPSPVYCISPVSSSWPFVTVLCQPGIWNQPLFISSGLCLSLLVLPPVSHCIRLPSTPTLLFTLLYSFVLLLSYSSSCLLCSVCPSPSFSISCFPQVSSCFFLIFFFHTNTVCLLEMHTGGCFRLSFSQETN